MRILAIDHGERRLGLALSDPTGTLAIPLDTLERAGWGKDLARLRAVIEAHGVSEVVVGRPLTASGTVGAQAQAAGRFAARLRAVLAVPVVEVDERYSTAAADRALRETGGPRRTRRRRRDAVAAALILQPYLDRTRQTQALRAPGGDAMLAP